MAKKSRSPRFPSVDLGTALDMATRFFKKESRASVPTDVASKAIGYKSASGAAKTSLATLKYYGLLDSDRQGYRVSELAMRAIHPSAPAERQAALHQASRNPRIFSHLFDKYDGASDDALKSYLIRSEGFSDVGLAKALDSFRKTERFLEEVGEPVLDSDPDASDELEDDGKTAKVTTRHESQLSSDGPVVQFDLPRNNAVEIRLRRKVTATEFEQLKQVFELSKLAFVDESGNGETEN